MTQSTRSGIRLWTALSLGALPLAAGAQGAPMSPAIDAGALSQVPVTAQAGGNESGEAGEAGLAQVDDPDSAYAIRLALVDAHLRAALEAQRAGLTDEALGLAGHPEAEVMDDLRPEMEARGVADFSDALYAYADALADGAADADLVALYEGLSAQIDAAMRATGISDRVVYDALLALLKGAALGYGDAAEAFDPVAALEAQGFLAVAAHMAEGLAGSDNDTTRTAGEKAVAEIRAAASLLADAETPDPTILYAAAARIEFAGLRVK